MLVEGFAPLAQLVFLLLERGGHGGELPARLGLQGLALGIHGLLMGGQPLGALMLQDGALLVELRLDLRHSRALLGLQRQFLLAQAGGGLGRTRSIPSAAWRGILAFVLDAGHELGLAVLPFVVEALLPLKIGMIGALLAL